MKSFVALNRKITKIFVDQCSCWFGEIDGSEKEFCKTLQQQPWQKVIEFGGANRPLFKKSELNNYIGVDIDASFSWQSIYSEYFPQSCEEPLPVKVCADLIVSKYVLEHIPDNKKVFYNIKNMLATGGCSIHIFPLGFHPFSLANRLVGNRVAKVLIPIIRPGSEGVTGYPAYYDKCNSFSLESFLDELNFKYSVSYFFGAEDYFGFFAPLGCLIHIFNRVAHLCGLNIFASNAVLIIHKS